MPKHKTKGPLEIKGAAVPKQAFRSDVSISLTVVPRDSATAGRGLSALVHPSSLQQLLQEAACTSTMAPASTSDDSSPTTSALAGAHAATYQASDPAAASGSAAHLLAGGGSLFLQLASGSDCVLHTRPCAEVAAGQIQVDEVQQANLRLCPGEAYAFSIFTPGHIAGPEDAAADDYEIHSEGDGSSDSSDSEAGEDQEGGAPSQQPFELTDIDVEVRLLHGSSAIQVDARPLLQAFCSQCCGRVLAVNEYVVVDLPGKPPLLLRVTATNTLSPKEQQEVLGYHCFRGLFSPNTDVFFQTATPGPTQQAGAGTPPGMQPAVTIHAAVDSTAAAGHATDQLSSLTLPQQQHLQVNGHQPPLPLQQQQQEQQQQHEQPPVQSRVAAMAAAGVQLLHAKQRPSPAQPTNVVDIFTNDGEWFPVKKRLLRSCIALTKAVRDSGDTAPSVTVNIDTLTFDRVLIFLEAYALKRRPPRFAIHLLSDLKEAGKELGLRPLQEYCQRLLGDKQAALQVYSFADVQRANASGKVWLLLDGMVLDVGRWLPEHPGGATIIPKQSLDCDCGRFFEMYHASRESFLYIGEFYIGELRACDKGLVPMGGRQPPSADFMQQLREFTIWRQAVQQRAAASNDQAPSFKSF